MFIQRFGGLVNLNVHFHVVVPDGRFVDDGDGLRFAMHPVPTSADVLAILDWIVRRVARRLAADARDDDDPDAPPDVLAQVQAEAAATWRPLSDTKPTVRGADRLRAWHEGFSLHAGVVIADHDRDVLGLAHEPAAFAPSRAPPQAELDWDDASPPRPSSVRTMRARPFSPIIFGNVPHGTTAIVPSVNRPERRRPPTRQRSPRR